MARQYIYATSGAMHQDKVLINQVSIINNQKTLVNLGAIRSSTIFALALNGCEYGFIKPSEWRKLVGIKQGHRKCAELK